MEPAEGGGMSFDDEEGGGEGGESLAGAEGVGDGGGELAGVSDGEAEGAADAGHGVADGGGVGGVPELLPATPAVDSGASGCPQIVSRSCDALLALLSSVPPLEDVIKALELPDAALMVWEGGVAGDGHGGGVAGVFSDLLRDSHYKVRRSSIRDAIVTRDYTALSLFLCSRTRAAIDAPDAFGRTALHVACLNADVTALQLLCSLPPGEGGAGAGGAGGGVEGADDDFFNAAPAAGIAGAAFLPMADPSIPFERLSCFHLCLARAYRAEEVGAVLCCLALLRVYAAAAEAAAAAGAAAAAAPAPSAIFGGIPPEVCEEAFRIFGWRGFGWGRVWRALVGAAAARAAGEADGRAGGVGVGDGGIGDGGAGVECRFAASSRSAGLGAPDASARSVAGGSTGGVAGGVVGGNSSFGAAGGGFAASGESAGSAVAADGFAAGSAADSGFAAAAAGRGWGGNFSIDAADGFGGTVLHRAAELGRPAIVAALLRLGATPWRAEADDGTFPIHRAIESRDLESFALLLACTRGAGFPDGRPAAAAAGGAAGGGGDGAAGPSVGAAAAPAALGDAAPSGDSVTVSGRGFRGTPRRRSLPLADGEGEGGGRLTMGAADAGAGAGGAGAGGGGGAAFTGAAVAGSDCGAAATGAAGSAAAGSAAAGFAAGSASDWPTFASSLLLKCISHGSWRCLAHLLTDRGFSSQFPISEGTVDELLSFAAARGYSAEFSEAFKMAFDDEKLRCCDGPFVVAEAGEAAGGAAGGGTAGGAAGGGAAGGAAGGGSAGSAAAAADSSFAGDDALTDDMSVDGFVVDGELASDAAAGSAAAGSATAGAATAGSATAGAATAGSAAAGAAAGGPLIIPQQVPFAIFTVPAAVSDLHLPLPVADAGGGQPLRARHAARATRYPENASRMQVLFSPSFGIFAGGAAGAAAGGGAGDGGAGGGGAGNSGAGENLVTGNGNGGGGGVGAADSAVSRGCGEAGGFATIDSLPLGSAQNSLDDTAAAGGAFSASGSPSIDAPAAAVAAGGCAAVAAVASGCGVARPRIIRVASRAALADVLRVHEWAYIARLLHYRSRLAASAGGGGAAGDVAPEFSLDVDTPFSHRSLDAALFAAGLCIAAVRAVCLGNQRRAFCAVRPPGHHVGVWGPAQPTAGAAGSGFAAGGGGAAGGGAAAAGSAAGFVFPFPIGATFSGGAGSVAGASIAGGMAGGGGAGAADFTGGTQGFCLLNNVAIAAAYAKYHFAESQGIRRVAIVDFDVHHGNGTEQIVRNLRPRSRRTSCVACDPVGGVETQVAVAAPFFRPWLGEDDADETLFLSIHGFDGTQFYPCTGPEGAIDEPSVVNVAFPRGGSPAKYRALWTEKILRPLADFEPDLVLVSAGFDAHNFDDSVNEGFGALSEFDYFWLTRGLVAVANKFAKGRIVSVLEGGYNTRAGVLSPFARSVRFHVKALAETPLAMLWQPAAAPAPTAAAAAVAPPAPAPTAGPGGLTRARLVPRISAPLLEENAARSKRHGEAAGGEAGGGAVVEAAGAGGSAAGGSAAAGSAGAAAEGGPPAVLSPPGGGFSVGPGPPKRRRRLAAVKALAYIRQHRGQDARGEDGSLSSEQRPTAENDLAASDVAAGAVNEFVADAAPCGADASHGGADAADGDGDDPMTSAASPAPPTSSDAEELDPPYHPEEAGMAASSSEESTSSDEAVPETAAEASFDDGDGDGGGDGGDDGDDGGDRGVETGSERGARRNSGPVVVEKNADFAAAGGGAAQNDAAGGGAAEGAAAAKALAAPSASAGHLR